MQVAGLTKLSLVDWPGKVCAVVFTRGCNFRCPWCFNLSLVISELYAPLIPQDAVRDYLYARRSFLDGVVITGGEPTLQSNLIDFIRQLKSWGYQVKIDTNGSQPAVLQKILDCKPPVIDCLAIDLKAPLDPDKYSRAAGLQVNIEDLKQSLRGAVHSVRSVYLRTTIIPEFHSQEDIKEIENIYRNLKKINPHLVQVFQEYQPPVLKR